MTRLFRAFAFLALGLLLGGSASYSFAGYAQLKPPANVGGSVGSRVTAGAVSANAGQFSAGFTTQIAGKTVTMPATMRFASNAAQFAIGAIRLNPTALIGSAVAAWLLTEGIEYVNGQFMKTGETVPLTPAQDCYEKAYGMGTVCGADAYFANVVLGYPSLGPYQQPVVTATDIKVCRTAPNEWFCFQNNKMSSVPESCPAGTTPYGESCIGEAVPATEPDWDTVKTSPLPDPVAIELAPKGVPLPLENPQFNPDPVKVPLSDPYPKPNGQPGETVKDVAKVTPAPDEKVKIETEVQPVTGPNGVPIPTTNPDGSSNPEAAPEEKPDFCIENPDALACWKDGKPEDVDLTKDTKNVAITPQGGWGPDTATCPQPRKHVLKNGYTVQMSWEPVCDGAGMFRPVVLGLAWLAAIYAFMAMYRKSQA